MKKLFNIRLVSENASNENSKTTLNDTNLSKSNAGWYLNENRSNAGWYISEKA